MINSEIQLNDYPKIDSYSELWARSRKNPFLYPGVQKKIRTTLLNEVNHGEGKGSVLTLMELVLFLKLELAVITSLAVLHLENWSYMEYPN